MQRCPHCHRVLKDDHKYCPECGTATGEADPASPRKQETGRTGTLLNTLLLVVLAAAIAVFAMDNSSGAVVLTDTEKPPLEAAVFSDDPSAISIAAQSVVQLNCYDQNGVLCASGSGFSCFSDDIIVTNYHVIEEKVSRIEAFTEENSSFDIPYVLATDKETDIAILSTEKAHHLPPLPLGDSDHLQKGETVVAIGGAPDLSDSVAVGAFSGYTDAFFRFAVPGSGVGSGGALCNEAGAVLGITFSSYKSGETLHLAVPINQVKTLYAAAEHSGKKALSEIASASPVICNTETGTYHPGDCYDATVGKLNVKYKDDGLYVYESLEDALALGYLACPVCGSGS